VTATVIPLNEAAQPFLVPAFEVKVHRAPMPREVVRDVIELTYQDSMDQVDSFTLVLNNWDAERQRPKFVGLDARDALWRLVQPGNEVQIQMGYQGRAPDVRIMTTGYITTLEADFPEAGASRLTVRGLNVLDRFRKRQYTWAWPAERNGTVRDSEIARELSRQPDTPEGRPGLGIEVRVNDEACHREVPQTYVMMNNQYPVVFLMQRARANGYDLFLARDTDNGEPFLYFGPSDRVRDRTYRLEWGKSLVSVRPTISTTRQVKKVTVIGWDRTRKEAVRGEATIEKDSGDMAPADRALAQATGREEVVTDQTVSTQQAAQEMARRLLQQIGRELIEVTGVVVGLPDLRAGRNVELGRLGPRLDGNYFVTETTHTINDSGYRTTFKARKEGRSPQ
jgi:phage protein D